MAYDIFSGNVTARDWSLGGSSFIGRGTFKRSNEMIKTKTQALALAKLVDKEIKANAALGVLRFKNGSLTDLEMNSFKKFYTSWHNWNVREIESGKTPTAKTVEELNRWRTENADWTKHMSATAARPAPVLVNPGPTAPPPPAPLTQPSKQLAPAPASGGGDDGKWKIFAAIAALLGLGAVVVGGKKS